MKGAKFAYVVIFGQLVCGCGSELSERYTCLDLCEVLKSDLEDFGIIDPCQDPIWHDDVECIECVDNFRTKYELALTPTRIPPCDEGGRYNHEYFEYHKREIR